MYMTHHPRGSLLQVDVSGFTRLSEAFSSLGTEGCEEFSLVMSGFLARMCKIIQEHGGDIDCFAGDALLVEFSRSQHHQSVVTASNGAHDGGKVGRVSMSDDSDSGLHLSKNSGNFGSTGKFLTEIRNDVIRSSSSFTRMVGVNSLPQVKRDTSCWEDCGIEICDAVTSAVACATAICRELNGFRASENHPPLGIHAALSAGTVYAVECGKDLVDLLAAFLFIA